MNKYITKSIYLFKPTIVSKMHSNEAILFFL